MGHLKEAIFHQNIHYLKQNNPRLIALSFIAAMLVTITLPLGTTLANRKPRPTNHNNIVSATETNYALSTTGVLNDSDQLATKTDTDSAATTNINGSTVDIPKDAEQGVTFGAEGQTLDIQLPNANTAALAKQAAPGVIAYDSGNGSANAVQPTEDGGVRMLTIIDNPNAPTTYDYKINAPDDGQVILTKDGGAVIVGSSKKVLSTIDKPWARDGAGESIKTWFTTDGRILKQHVQHNEPGVVYPVVADPRVSRSWHGVTVWFNKGDMKWISSTAGAAAALGAAKFPQASAIAGTVSFLADQASRRGFCLAIYRSFWLGAPLVAWVYKC